MLRTPIDNHGLAVILRSLRVKRKLSIPQLAKRTAYSKHFISEIEQDKVGVLDFSVLLHMLDCMNYDLLIVPREQHDKHK
jgi:transcriptional regulator with XRE-family HTH domain